MFNKILVAIADIAKSTKMTDTEMNDFTLLVNQWVDALNNMRIADKEYHKAVALQQENHVELLATSVATKVSFKYINAKFENVIDILTLTYKRNYVAAVFMDLAKKRAKAIGAE